MDLLSTRLSNLMVRLEKTMTMLQNSPTGADLERIDVQVGMLRSSVGEVLSALGKGPSKQESNTAENIKKFFGPKETKAPAAPAGAETEQLPPEVDPEDTQA
jgi:hypothetical protein